MTDKQKARAIARLSEKFIRLAYELELDAARLGEAGKGDASRGVREIARHLGDLGRHHLEG